MCIHYTYFKLFINHIDMNILNILVKIFVGNSFFIITYITIYKMVQKFNNTLKQQYYTLYISTGESRRIWFFQQDKY